MKRLKFSSLSLFALVTCCLASPLRAQETVAIPKSRLEELERKAAELEKLKKELNRAQGEKEQLKGEQERLKTEKEQLKMAKEEAEAKAVVATAKAEPKISHVSPPLASLPPLQAGELVNALDLMNHYAADAVAAEQRYGKGTLRVQGEVVGLEKPMFVRPYTLLLKTADSQRKIVCTVHPPEQYKTLYTVKNGTEMAWKDERHGPVMFVKVGQTVMVEGRCKGLHDANVALGSCVLKSAQ
jgi:hypothetical protein